MRIARELGAASTMRTLSAGNPPSSGFSQVVRRADTAAMAIPQCVGGPYIPQRELARKGPDYKPAALVT